MYARCNTEVVHVFLEKWKKIKKEVGFKMIFTK